VSELQEIFELSSELGGSDEFEEALIVQVWLLEASKVSREEYCWDKIVLNLINFNMECKIVKPVTRNKENSAVFK
jgi:hypothetical protein